MRERSCSTGGVTSVRREWAPCLRQGPHPVHIHVCTHLSAQHPQGLLAATDEGAADARGAEARDNVAREPEEHLLGRRQEAALLEGHAKVDWGEGGGGGVGRW